MNTLLVTQKEHVVTIAFNRPENMNTFNVEMADELIEVTEQLALMPELRAVMLKGEGRLFMAGGDIQYFYQQLDIMPKGVKKVVRKLAAVTMNLTQLNVPILACVHGSVAGAGMSLMMAADLVLAEENTKFTMAYSRLATSPDGGASYFLPRLVGTKKAMELLLLSENITTEQAKELGLINWCCPENVLWQKAEELLHRLASGPTQAFARIKSLVNNSWSNSFEKQLEQEAQAFVDSTATEDFKNAVMGFVNKKKS